MRTCQNPIIPGFYPDPSVCRVGEATARVSRFAVDESEAQRALNRADERRGYDM